MAAALAKELEELLKALAGEPTFSTGDLGAGGHSFQPWVQEPWVKC